MRRKYGDEMLVEAVCDHSGGHLYHLTDESHLTSIEEHGLLSGRSMQELGVIPAFPGGNNISRTLDGGLGLDDMIFLSFFNKNVMPRHEYSRLRRPVLLKIDARILYLPRVRVALGQANRVRTQLYSAARAFFEMDWMIIEADRSGESIPSTDRPRFFRVINYEVLVPHRISPEYIVGIV